MIFKEVLFVDPLQGAYTGNVEVKNGKIVKIIKRECSPKFILMPGFVDLHTHAQKGIDAMYADYKDYEKWAKNNFEQGVTTFLPTTVSASIEALEKIIDKSQELPLSVAGLHLEGPFVNPIKKGAQNGEFIFPSEGKNLSKILRKPVKLITAAPEIAGFKNLYKECTKNGIEISIGHTAAGFEDMIAAFDLGIKKITHFPNALTPLHHREIGGTGSGLYFDFSLEMIVDGIHSSPEFVNLIYRIKGADRIFLITDSMAAAGMPNGKYELGGLDVFVKDGKAVLENGALAGSTLLFKNAVKNFSQFTNCTYQELAKVSSYNSLKQMKMIDEVGLIQEGYKANLVLLDMDLNLKQTIFEGEAVYSNI
jgi:N-acetylglucosamine-6-phosphate deacetylase